MSIDTQDAGAETDGQLRERMTLKKVKVFLLTEVRKNGCIVLTEELSQITGWGVLALVALLESPVKNGILVKERDPRSNLLRYVRSPLLATTTEQLRSETQPRQSVVRESVVRDGQTTVKEKVRQVIEEATPGTEFFPEWIAEEVGARSLTLVKEALADAVEDGTLIMHPARRSGGMFEPAHYVRAEPQ